MWAKGMFLIAGITAGLCASTAWPSFADIRLIVQNLCASLIPRRLACDMGWKTK